MLNVTRTIVTIDLQSRVPLTARMLDMEFFTELNRTLLIMASICRPLSRGKLS